MPHGGLDHLFGRAAFEPYTGKWWRLTFAGLYLGLAAFVVAGWLLIPALTVVLFFLVSAYHFAHADGRSGLLGLVEGGAVIWLPMLARPADVAGLLAWVMPGGNQADVLSVFDQLVPFLWILAAVYSAQIVLLIARAVTANSMVCVADAVRLILFAAVFALLPVLVSFGLFFCGWHSTRELATLARRVDVAQPWRGFRRVILLAAPRAGVSVVATAIAAWWFAAGREVTPVVVQAVFLGLSAVAVPHILLHAFAEYLGADPFAPAGVPA